MNLEDLFAHIRALPDADFHRLSDEMYVISREREARDQVEAGQAQLVAELQDAGKLEKPDAATAEQAQEHAETARAGSRRPPQHQRSNNRLALMTLTARATA